MKINFNKFLESNRNLRILSLVSAALLWYGVVSGVDKNSSKTLRGIPVEIDVAESAAGRMGLEAITIDPMEVDVVVSGSRSVIGNISDEDVQVTAVVSGVSEPGTYELRLEGYDRYQKGIEVSFNKQSTVSVRFDHVKTKKMPVAVELVGLEIPEGYVKDAEHLSPEEVSITGPEVELNKVDRVVARVQIDGTLEKNASYQADVLLLDAQGQELDSSYLSVDYEQVDVTIPILKKKTVPLSVSFVNAPPGFEPEAVGYSLSLEEIEIAGPAEQIDQLERLDLGVIDVRYLDGESSYTFTVELPGGYLNIEGVQEVVASFTNPNIERQRFTVSNIQLPEQPEGYEVTIATKSIYSVQVLGLAGDLQELGSQDLVAQVQLDAGEIRVGQMTVPVLIYAPEYPLVWAYGDYSVVITVRQQQ